MTVVLRQAHAIVAWVFVAVIAFQVFLAGAAIPQLGGNNSFATHIDMGYSIVGMAALALVIAALAARAGRGRVLMAAGLLGLYVVQTLLPLARGSMPWLAALHPVNALVLFALAAWYARSAWRDRAGRPVG